MPLVSVIIPCFNQAGFLKDAVDSVLAQTHPEVEIIIVNDGSTDNTEQIAANFLTDHRCRYVRQENLGLPAARNRGIEESAGAYLNFLDADDWLEPTKLEEQAHILDSHAEVGLVYCDIFAEYQDGQNGEELSIGESRRILNGDLFESLLISGYFPPHTVMIRRNILEQVGCFDPDLGGHADYDLWLRVAGSGHLAYYLDKRLAHYRIHGSNMSKDREGMRETRLRTLRKIARLYPDRFARAVDAVQQALEDLSLSRRWVNEQRAGLQAEARALAAQLTQLSGQLAQKEQEVQGLSGQLAEEVQKVQGLSGQLAQKEQEVQGLSGQLAQITSSTGWSLLQFMWTVRLWLAPHASRRERAGHLALHALGVRRRSDLRVATGENTGVRPSILSAHDTIVENNVSMARLLRPKLPLVLLTAIILLLAGIDVWWLRTFRSGYPLTIDEAGYISFALSFTDALRSGGLHGLWHAYETGTGSQAPLVPLLTVPALLIFGERIMVSIAAQIAFFAILVIASYGIGRRLTNAYGGLLTGVAVAAIPAVTDFARSYYFVVLSAALFACAIYAQLQSNSLLRRRWAVLWGLLLGLTLLSRTMMIAFLPSLVLVGLAQVAVDQNLRARRLLNVTIGLVVAALTAGTWYFRNWGYVFSYLTSYGYGANSVYYNHGHSHLDWRFWLDEVTVLTTRYLYVPLTAVLLLCLGAGLMALTVRREYRVRRTSIVSFLRGDVFVLMAVLAEGYLALSSSQNEGTGFWVPLLPPLIALSVAALWPTTWPGLRPLLASALVIISAFNVAMKADVSAALSMPRVVSGPVLGSLAVTNGHSEIQSYMDVAAHRQLLSDGGMPPVDREWLSASTQLAAWVQQFSAEQHRVPVVFLASRDPLFNTNTFGLMTRLYWHTTPLVGQLDAGVGGDAVAAYERQLTDPEFGQPNILVTSDQLAPGEFPPVVTQSYAVEAAQSLGFQLMHTLSLPDGRKAEVWWLERGPVTGGGK